MSVTIEIGRLVRRLPSQYPFVLVDRVLDHDPKRGLVALKNVTGAEDFFQGHFPGEPVMPGVLLMESLAQTAGIWLLANAPDPGRVEVHVVGIDGAKFRRTVVPGDQLRLEVKVLHRRGPLYRMRGEARVGEHRAAEARLLLREVVLPEPQVDPTARIAPGAILAAGVRVGPYSVVGPQVTIGPGSVLEAHVVIDGRTEIGRNNHFFPFSCIGLPPQDLKYRGEESRVVIGDRNVFREAVTVHRGTVGGGMVTRIGSDNLLMAYVHLAHDCQVGNHAILAASASFGGHVEIADHATVGGSCGVHQFCRIGQHAFIGGFSVATKDVLPYSLTVGNRACIYGVNAIGLRRKGFSSAVIGAIRKAYRTLLQSHLNTSDALERIESDGPLTPEVQLIVDFIRASRRGVILKRRRRSGSIHDDEEANA